MSDETLTDADTVEAIEDTRQEAASTTAPAPAPAVSAAKPPASGRRRPGSRSGRPSVRRIADKAEQTRGVDETTRTLAAGLTGARSARTADLTTAIMEAKRSPVESAIADLSGIQSGSVPEATVQDRKSTRLNSSH